MSGHHGGTVTLRPIGEVAAYLKRRIPACIPQMPALKPALQQIAGEETLRTGVAAFREFICLICDRLAADGAAYAKPPANPKDIADYPFLSYLSNLLADIGYYGILSEGGDALRLTNLPVCIPAADAGGKAAPARIPAAGRADCLRFLAACGLVLTGIDPEDKTLRLSERQPLVVTCPDRPGLLTGLKALSVADMEWRPSRRFWNDLYLLRCDYSLLMQEEADPGDLLADFLHPLPAEVQTFAQRLHQRYTRRGMLCAVSRRAEDQFAYAAARSGGKTLIPKDICSRAVWRFSHSLQHGYCLVVKAKRMNEYAAAAAGLAPLLREKIALGYGCDCKRGERCQRGCQGIRIPLDDAITGIAGQIETWLDYEMPGA